MRDILHSQSTTIKKKKEKEKEKTSAHNPG
jgi:hypothetical protein